MKYVLLANIGNRNICFSDKNIEKEDFFEETKYYFENIEESIRDIELKILPDILGKYKINKIYLFVTNQWFKQDTYYEGKIIKYILEKEGKEVFLVEKKDDPRVRDKAFNFFENFFDKHQEFEKQNLVISGSGWVPAMKEALNFYSIVKFKKVIIADVDEGWKGVFYSNIEQEYLKNFDKKILKEMINNFDYSGAYVFLKNSRIDNLCLERRLLYLSNRYNFSFVKANNLMVETKLNFLEKIDENKPRKLEEILEYKERMIKELFDNIEVTFKKWEYTSFLGKTFSLRENIIYFLFEKKFKINTDIDFEKIKNEWVKIKEWNSGKKYVDIFSLEEKLNEKFFSNDEEFKEFKKFSDFLKKKLKEIRNKSIMAHWFGGVEISEVEDSFRKLKEFKRNFLKVDINIFEQINKEILKSI